MYRSISKEFMEIQDSCISKEQWGWRQGLRPTLGRRRSPRQAGEKVLARRSLQGRLARKPSPYALQGRLARKSSPDALQGRLARMAPPDARKLVGVGRIVRRGGNPPDAGLTPSNPEVPDARDIVGHGESTMLEGFPERQAISRPGKESARRSQACGRREEICPGENPHDARSTRE